MPIFWLLFDDGKEWPAGAHFFGYHRPLGVVIAMVLTLGIASLSYRYFERPILRLKNRFETVKTRPA
jgi:peptidoglycan/LPS O-acetylase OafA/YrhL